MGQQYPAQPVPAVAAVVVRRNADKAVEVLLVLRANPPSQGEWSLPGGVLELGETLEAGVVREVQEETGVLVEPVVVLEVLDHIIRDAVGDQAGLSIADQQRGRVRFHYVLIDFLCRAHGGSAAAATDALEARWVNRQELRSFEASQLSPRTLRVIEKGFVAFDESA